jgi:hypothetical protein
VHRYCPDYLSCKMHFYPKVSSCRKKYILKIITPYFFILITRHANFAPYYIQSSTTFWALPHFSFFFFSARFPRVRLRQDFFIFCSRLLHSTFHHPGRSQRGIIINVFRSSCKVPSSFQFYKIKFFRLLLKKVPNIKSSENPSTGEGFFHADRQTNKTKPTAAFRSFSSSPMNKDTYFFV